MPEMRQVTISYDEAKLARGEQVKPVFVIDQLCYVPMTQVEAYLETERDRHVDAGNSWSAMAIDDMLDDVRMRIACGADLEQQCGLDPG